MTEPEPNLTDAVQTLNQANSDLESLCGMAVELYEQMDDGDPRRENAEMLWQRLDELLERYKQAFTEVEMVRYACEQRIEQIEADSRWAPDDPAQVQVNAPLALQQATMQARHNTLHHVLGNQGFGAGLEPMAEEDER